jgi:hypothetical protein
VTVGSSARPGQNPTVRRITDRGYPLEYDTAGMMVSEKARTTKPVVRATRSPQEKNNKNPLTPAAPFIDAPAPQSRTVCERQAPALWLLRCPFPYELGHIFEIAAVGMPNIFLAGSFQNYDLMLTSLAIQLQLKFQSSILRNLSLRILELSELYEGSSGTIIFNEKNHISSPWAARP